MELGEFRPIISGLLGGLIAIWLGTTLRRWIPSVCNGKSVEILILEYRYAIRCANMLLVIGLLFAGTLYWAHTFPKEDWRALALGVGGGCLAALLSLAFSAVLKRSPMKEAYVAYAVSQQAPVLVIFSILTICVVLFFIAASTLLL